MSLQYSTIVLYDVVSYPHQLTTTPINAVGSQPHTTHTHLSSGSSVTVWYLCVGARHLTIRVYTRCVEPVMEQSITIRHKQGNLYL